MQQPIVYSEILEDYKVVNSDLLHEVIIDEPLDLGGKNQGMDPKTALLASIASCKLITLKMVANRKSWDASKTKIELKLVQHESFNEIIQKIYFPNTLSKEQQLKLIEISHKCPLVKLLANSFTFTHED